jgi:hypothetical protein
MRAVYLVALRLLRGSGLATLAALLLSAGTVAASDAGIAQGVSAAVQSGTGKESISTSAGRRAPRSAASIADIRRLIDLVARQHGVEAALVHAVVAAESAYNTHAVSPVGAVGLMQLMPATALDYGVDSRAALFDPSTNVDIGVRHLKRLLRKYRDDYGHAIMAYNAGEGVVDRTGSNVRFAETLDYTEAVVRHYRKLGGTKPTEHVLRKVSVLRQRPNADPPVSTSPVKPDSFGLLPTTSARLEARLPSASLDGLSSSAGADDERRIAGGRSALGSGLRPGIDPAIRDAARVPPYRHSRALLPR